MPYTHKLPSKNKAGRPAAHSRIANDSRESSSLKAPATVFSPVQKKETSTPPPNLNSTINSTIKALNAERKKPSIYVKYEGNIYLKPPKYSHFQKDPDFQYEENRGNPLVEVVGVKGFTNFSVKVGKGFMEASPEEKKAMLRPAIEAGISRYNKKSELEQISHQKGGFDGKDAETMVRHLLELASPQYANLVNKVEFAQDHGGISLEGTRAEATIRVGKEFLTGIKDETFAQKKETLLAAIQSYEAKIGAVEDRIVTVGSKKADNPAAATINSAEAVYKLINLYLPRYKEIIGGVGYSSSVDNVKVESDNSLMLTVGKDFMDNFSKDQLSEKAAQLRQAIQADPSTEELLIKLTGPQLIEELIKRQMPKYHPIIEQIKYHPALDGIEVKTEGKKLKLYYGQTFGKELIAEIKDKEQQQLHNRSLVNALNFELNEPAEALLKEKPSEFRSAVIESLKDWAGYDEKEKKYKGTKEGSEKFAKFRTTENLNAARKQSAVEGRTFTTCIDFQGHILGDATGKQKNSLKGNSGINIDEQAAGVGAWNKAYKDMPKTYRPKKGDVYLLAKSESNAAFSHTGFINDITVHEDGTETWKTIDGGQGTSAQYVIDPNGTHEVTVSKTVDGETKVETIKLREQRAGEEELKEVTRKYDPATNILSVPYNKGKGVTQDLLPRWLKGWVDIDKYVKK
ncbi:MAG: hypothetical protein AAF587_23295 [Bacteroidota bacterium]